MEQRQGLINFAANIKPVMLKIKDSVNGKAKPAKLNLSEQHSILEFYLEVIDYLCK